jgi:uncharacterized membrane protein (UPF0127 family)
MKVMRHFSKIVGIAFGVFLAVAASGYRYLTPVQQMPVTPLQIETPKELVDFEVEVATTRNQQERGLMYRRSLAPGTGMLFDLKVPKQISFWMKDTYIPLDIIFIDNGGKIVRVAANAKPLSEDLVRSLFSVRAVLEINGGEAARLGVEPGNTVVHTIFNNVSEANGR